MTFPEFSIAVNKLAQAEADRLMDECRQGKRLFGAEHNTYSDMMLQWHFQQGQTPAQAFAQIVKERD